MPVLPARDLPPLVAVMMATLQEEAQPCRARPASTQPKPGPNAAVSEPATSSPRATNSRRRRPYMSAMRESTGVPTAPASSVIVTSHEASSAPGVSADGSSRHSAWPKPVRRSVPTILRSASDVARLRASDGGPISIHGSATLVHSLQEHHLIDRYHLLVFPVLLGAGKRLFSGADLDAQKLKLVDSAVYSNGIQKNVFDVLR